MIHFLKGKIKVKKWKTPKKLWTWTHPVSTQNSPLHIYKCTQCMWRIWKQQLPFQCSLPVPCSVNKTSRTPVSVSTGQKELKIWAELSSRGKGHSDLGLNKPPPSLRLLRKLTGIFQIYPERISHSHHRLYSILGMCPWQKHCQGRLEEEFSEMELGVEGFMGSRSSQQRCTHPKHHHWQLLQHFQKKAK